MRCPHCKQHFDSNQDKWRKSRKGKGKCSRCNRGVRPPKMNKNGKLHFFSHCNSCLFYIRTRHRLYRQKRKSEGRI